MFKVTQFDPRVLSWWRTQRRKIDMEPPYQRKGRLWSVEDKAFLIDSILNDYDVPKAYIADFTLGTTKLNKKNLPYAIIDGKQRFEAIFDFFDNSIALAPTFIYREDPDLQLGGLTYSNLRTNYPDVADKFDNYHLSVMRVLTDEEPQINELFVRLNRSKPLTGAEIRNAMVGPAPALMRELVKHDFFQVNAHFKTARGEDLNTAAKVLLFEFYGELGSTKRADLDRFVKETRDRRADLEQAARRTADVLDQMASVFAPNDALLGSAGIVPVYYWLVRHIEQQHQPHLREFLVRFEEARLANRRRPKDSKDAPLDQELVAFDNFNRSTNDEPSHRGRFEILRKRFDSYLRSKTSAANSRPRR